MSQRKVWATGRGSSSWNKIRKPLAKAINQTISSHFPFLSGAQGGLSPARVFWATCRARNISSSRRRSDCFLSRLPAGLPRLCTMDLGVTMSISQIQGCLALPLETGGKKWGGERERKKRIRKSSPGTRAFFRDFEFTWRHPSENQGSGLAQGMLFRWPFLRQGRGGSGCAGLRCYAGSALWHAPSRTFPEVPEKTRHPGRQGPRSADCQLADTSEGRQSLGGGPAAPSPGARPPQLNPPASACAQPHVGGVSARACVSVVGGGGAFRAAPSSVRFIRDTLIYNQIHLIKFLSERHNIITEVFHLF